MNVVTRIGRLDDPRIKRVDGKYYADGIVGAHRTWLLAFEALDDLDSKRLSRCEKM
jgi:hypothetical protein